MGFPDIKLLQPLADALEAKYKLAARLADHMRLGEAVRILESLGDYKNSQALLREILEIKAYADGEDEKLRRQRREREQAQARRAEADRRRRVRWAVVAALAAVVGWLLMRGLP